MAFVNRVRLPFKITRPQFQEERDIFRESNGRIRVLNSVIRKRYEGETDHWPEKLHERFKIALSHDHVTIEGEKYVGEAVQDGDYTIDWPDFLDYPFAKAQFYVFATPFDASNSNCGSCEDFTQVVANDDIIEYDVPENHQISMSPLDNDDICCDPATISIVTANPTYVESVMLVEETNSVIINTKASFASQPNVVLVTYRVQCENGQYDEANIIANMVGTMEPPCESPTALVVSATSTTAVALDWEAPTNPPASYEYRLYIPPDFGVPVQTGTTVDTELNLGSLEPGTAYRLYVRSQCSEENVSDWQYIDFATQAEDQPPICGRYSVKNNIAFGLIVIRYMDCNGVEQATYFAGPVTKEFCMLQNTPGTPVYFSGAAPPYMVLTYLGEC